MMWRDGDWGWWLVMPALTVAFWGVVIWAILTVVRGRPESRSRFSERGGAEQILAERYARGEIDDEEYHRRLDTLRDRTRVGQQR